MGERPLTLREAAERTGTSARTIRWNIVHGRLKAQQLPGRTGAWLVEVDDLDEWVRQQPQRSAVAELTAEVERLRAKLDELQEGKE